MTTFAAADGTSLHEMTWTPSGKPRGAVVLLHGYGEHIARYDETARALSAAGWAVRGADLRGHGESAGRRGFVRRFDEYLDDAALLIGRARETAGPLFLLGHSFGGLIATHVALQKKAALDGLILSSPFFRLALAVPAVKIFAGKLFSSLIPTLALPAGLKGADVTRDPELAALYDRDPLNNKNATARWFTETQTAQEQALARASELTLPCLVMHGGGDKVADPRATEELFAGISSKDKTLKIYEGQYHEIFNEPAADRVKTFADVVAWLDARGSVDAGEKLHAHSP
ncbi:MAG TPA: alpha/beta hydrolase [Polyangia bacterium]|nr:alpha/beta hydrolase [Polyangia bacterium]